MKKKIVSAIHPVAKASAELEEEVKKELEECQEEKSIGALLNETKDNCGRKEASGDENC